jgi:NitT/TauT family transport system substrate-binding protein
VAGEGASASIEPFLLKKDAETAAKRNGGKVVGFADAVKAAGGA